MATVTQSRVRGRQAHPPGPTFLSYTPNGRRLVTAGCNTFIRIYETGSSGEPVNVDDCQENNLAVAATNDFFIIGAEDGMVTMYSLETNQYEKMLVRCTLPIRDIALSPDGQWVAIASDELTVKIVSTRDPENKYFYIRDLYKPAKHVTYDPTGSYLTISCSDGVVYLYKISTEEPQIVRKIEGTARALETDAEASSRAAWHPDGRAFAVATPLREIQVISSADGEKQRMFTGEHTGDITALAWSPNGALLLTAGMDKKLVLWDTITQKALAKYEYPNVTDIVWHPHQNLVSFATSDGEIFIYQDFVPTEHTSFLEHTLVRAPFLHDPLGEVSGNARKNLSNGTKPNDESRRRKRSPDPIDQLLGLDSDQDDFVEDDDGAGYALNGNGKRTNGHLDDPDDDDSKRRAVWDPSIHEAFQPGSTPWRGNRRYLCLNLIGFVWTVDQDTSHHTITVEFYDREFQRDFHFTDPYLYDKACLNEHGTLFSSPSSGDTLSMIYYRPHETWTARADWRIKLPPGEDVTSIALSDSYIVATTSANYIRVYTLYGVPFRIFRSKSTPAVTCAAWRDYILTMGNGPVGSDGTATLLYSIENVRRDDVCQSEDIVALPKDGDIQTVFFSDRGDPYIYDSDGVLLVLQHWRSPGQAKWVPLLDTRLLDRLATGRKEESYWPVAVAQEKFHCIILKGGDKYPYFPRPLLTEFDFQIPISSVSGEKKKNPVDDEMDQEGDENEASASEGPKLEELYIRHSILHSLVSDLVESTNSTHAQRAEPSIRDIEIDKTLLQLMNIECREGEERGAKALEIAGLLRDSVGGGKMLEAARRIAARYDQHQLVGKIEDLANRRLLEGMEDL